MKVTTQQVDGPDALRAVADGKRVQMIWECDGEPHFSDFRADILDKMSIGRAWLIVNFEDDENKPENCEIAAEEIHPEPPTEIVTDQEIEKSGPLTVEIPNSRKTVKARWRKIDEDRLIDMKKRGMHEREIADILDVTQPTVHNHVEKLRKEGKL